MKTMRFGGDVSFLELKAPIDSRVGSVNAKELIANIVEANVNGVGSAEVYASDSLHAAVNGIGALTYYGNPKKTDIGNSIFGGITKGE